MGTSKLDFPVNLTIDGEKFTLTRLLGQDPLTDICEVELANNTTASQFYAKIARSTRNNDLLEREHQNLLLVASPANDEAIEKFVASQRICFPYPFKSSLIDEDQTSKRRVNIQCIAPGFHLTAQQLSEESFPKGMPLEHVYWIFRHVLLTLWAAHLHAGIVHGGVTPDHVLTYPDIVDGHENNGHGVILTGWTSSAQIGAEHVPVLNPIWEEFYPPEVREKALAAPSMDIFMAGALALYLAGGLVKERVIPTTMPQIVADDLLSCLEENPRKRPQDMEEFYRHFGKTIELAHGKREYAPLAI